MAAVIVLAMLAILALRRYSKTVIRWMEAIRCERLRRFAVQLVHASQEVTAGQLAGGMLAGIGAWSLNAVSFFVFFSLVCPGTIPTANVWLTFVLVSFCPLIPGLPGAIGAFEGAVILALASYVPYEQALVYGIVLHCSQFLPITVLFLCMVLFDRLDTRSLMSMPGNSATRAGDEAGSA